MLNRIALGAGRPGLAAVLLSLAAGTTARAALVTANAVTSYSAGTLANGYVYPASSWTSGPGLGLPATTEGGYFGDTGVITPFNAQFNPAAMVGLGGAGGSIVFHLSAPLATTGRTLGVQASVGLTDASYPSGNTGSVASYYNGDRSATVEVSQDGSHYVSLGDVLFDIPTNAYSDVSAAQTTTPGTTPADFSKPFTGTLASFNNESFSQVLATLNGSGGGKWLDLSGTGLSSVNYVEFLTAPGETMYVNAVTGVAAVPEPTCLAILGGGSLALLGRRRRVAKV